MVLVVGNIKGVTYLELQLQVVSGKRARLRQGTPGQCERREEAQVR